MLGAPTGISVTTTATVSSDIVYSTNEIKANGNTSRSESDKTNFSFAFGYGSGTGQINFATKVEGILGSGGSQVFDLTTIPKSAFGSEYNVELNTVKCIQVYNNSNNSGYDLALRATGTNAFTNLFNGGSGNNILKPMSSYIYSDPYDGLDVASNNKLLYLEDIGGSGASFQIMVGGILA